MNHSKIILVGIISAFVAVTTSVLGVTGTIIGSVISSVLYNMLSEALEKPVSDASISREFEWDLAYAFPLVVIAIIQLLLLFAFLAQWGFLPNTFLNIYLLLQNVVDNNLYRVLGCSLIIMSIYPFVLKPEHVNKLQGLAIAFVGVIFLARGFVDLGNRITDIYDDIFIYFDFPIALFTFLLLLFIILRIFYSSYSSHMEVTRDKSQKIDADNVRSKRVHNPKAPDFKSKQKQYKKNKIRQTPKEEVEVQFKKRTGVDEEGHEKRINRSVDNIQFESNDLLDDYK